MAFSVISGIFPSALSTNSAISSAVQIIVNVTAISQEVKYE